MSHHGASRGKGLTRFTLAILTLLTLSALVCVPPGRAKPTPRAARVGSFACSSPGTSTEKPNNRPPLHPNGTLVRASGTSTVYLIDGGRKRGIPSQSVLNNLYTNGGFNNNDVVVISQDELNQYSPGSDVSGTIQGNGRGQPDGRLVSNGSEVSIVTNGGGRRPFSSSARFQGLGYQFCNVVTLNSADYNSYQPVGMAVGDYPVLSSPQNGGTVQSSTPTLSWSGVAQASVYRVQIATSPNSLPSSPYFTECFSCAVNTSSSGTSYTPGAGALAPNTKYYWQIQAVNFPDQSVWSATWNFTTPASPPVIRVAPTTLNFDQTAAGAVHAGRAASTRPSAAAASSSQTFTIFNDGGSPLHVSDISIQHSSSWLSISPTTLPPFDIAASSSVSVTVVVDATGLGPGSYSDRLLVGSNDAARSPYPNGVFVNLTVSAPCQSASGIDPASGPVGTPVTVSGTNFTGVTSVKFGGGVTAPFSVDDDTQVTATVPAGAITGPITIVKGGCADALTQAFTVTAAPEPSPPSATTTAADSVTDATANLTGTVNPNGSDTTASFEWGTDATLTAHSSTDPLPIGSGTDDVPVESALNNLAPDTQYYFRVVATNDAGTTRGSIESFKTAAAGALRIDAVEPRAGRTSGGREVKLTGSFDGLSVVKIGGESVTFSFTNGTGEIAITTPPHAAGAVSIELASASGETYTKADAYAYLPTSFTDNQLVAGVTQAKAQHVVELRQAVDALRAVAGLPEAQWTDLSPFKFSTPVRAAHVVELRAYLEDAAEALGYEKKTYTDPGLGTGSVIKRVHVEELRLRVMALAGECPRCLL